MRRSAQYSRAPLTGRRAPGTVLSAALAALAALACLEGCAMYASIEAPAYGRAWNALAGQAAEASAPAVPETGSVDFGDGGEELEKACESVPEARRTLERARDVAAAPSPSSAEVKTVLSELEGVEEAARRKADADPRMIEVLRQRIAELRRRVEAKLLEISKIEPSFEIAARSRVKVAVLKIGDAAETIRSDERKLWADFLRDAGFSADVVFIPACLAGSGAGTAEVRVAAARLGADAALVYATFAAATGSPLGESAAVLAFAKCMLIDARTEYLYFNAEGECREKRVGVPGFLSEKGLELECIGRAVAGLRVEIRRELNRLSEGKY